MNILIIKNNISKLILLLSILLFIFNYNIEAEDKRSNLTLTGGGGLNTNIHFANFSNLPGIASYSPGYDMQLGFGHAVFAGFEYNLRKSYLGANLKFSGLVSYSNISAKLIKEEFLGHIITGDEYTKAISRHTLDDNISLVAIEPGIMAEPFDWLPLDLKAGLQIGYPLTKTAAQKEELISPDQITFKDDDRVRAEYDGEIPDVFPIYLAFSVGAKYDLVTFGNFEISPEITYNQGLTNIVRGRNWKISSLRAGISLSYTSPKYTPPPPAGAPLPLPPPPPKTPEPAMLELSMDVFVGGEKVTSGDIIPIRVSSTRYISSYSLIPEIYFDHNEVEADLNKEINLGAHFQKEKARKLIIVKTIQYLKENPDIDLTILASALDNEEDNIAEKRLNWIKNILASNGFDQDRIETRKQIAKEADYEHEELKTEQRKISFLFSDGKKLIHIENTERVVSKAEDIPLEIKPQIKTDAKSITFEGKLAYDGESIIAFPEDGTELIFNIKEYSNLERSPGDLEIKSIVKDPDDQKKTKNVTLDLLYRKEQEKVYTNSTESDEGRYEQYIIGFCKFDQSDFFVVDEKAISTVKEAVLSGKKVELLPLTDNLGAEAHNTTLARNRANAALKALDISDDQVDVSYDQGYLFSNEHPYGRMLNRTVVARIMRE